MKKKVFEEKVEKILAPIDISSCDPDITMLSRCFWQKYDPYRDIFKSGNEAFCIRINMARSEFFDTNETTYYCQILTDGNINLQHREDEEEYSQAVVITGATWTFVDVSEALYKSRVLYVNRGLFGRHSQKILRELDFCKTKIL